MTTMNLSLARSGPARDRVSRAAAVVAALTFGAIGLVSVALAMAFPLALGVVEQQPLAISAADLALADRIADYWWVLAAAGALHFVALLTVLDRGIWGKRVALVLSGVGAMGAAAVQVVLVTSGAAFGEGAAVTNGVALAYAVVVVAVVMIHPREAPAAELR